MLHILKTFGIVLAMIVGSLIVAVIISTIIYVVALFFVYLVGWPMLVCAGIATVLVLSIILTVAWEIGDRN